MSFYSDYNATEHEVPEGVPWYPQQQQQQQQQPYDYQEIQDQVRGGMHMWQQQQQQQHDMLHLHLGPRVQRYEDLEVKIRETFGSKNPVSMLMEFGQYLRQHVTFKEPIPCTGPDHIPRFTLAAVVGSRTFAPCEAGNKKDGRCGAALLAWTTLMDEQQQKFRSIISDDGSTWCDKVAAYAHLEYLQQVERRPQGFCGKKVLAAILLKKKQKKGRQDLVKVISLGTGNRTILSNHLEMNGKPVNDCHAELIARRASLRYLYSEVKALKSGSRESIFELCEETGLLRLRSCYSFHLYISTAPCGDAALFNRTDTENDPMEHKPIFDSDVQGVLRTKIEAGEGTIPIEKGYFQTWIGLKFGNRLRTMSCSDKICKWNVVGFQGALLSHFIKPVYLATVTVGDNFFWGHMARGLYYRLEPAGKAKPDWQLPSGFDLSRPELGHTDLEDMVVDTEKSSSITVTWTDGDAKADVLDGTTGIHLEEEEDQSPPQVSKFSLYEEFRTVCSIYNKPSLLATATYREAKMAASEYQQAKDALFERFRKLGYGSWVHKPEEVDYFGAVNK